MKQVEAASVQRLPRITGVTDGQQIADGAAMPKPATVIWATGYRPGFDWIAGLALDEHGLPVTRRGAVENMPGLYFVGMPVPVCADLGAARRGRAGCGICGGSGY